MGEMIYFDTLVARIQQEIPEFRVIKQGSTFLGRILRWVTVSLFSAKGFTQTIMNTVYVPDDFDTWSDKDQYRLIRHEVVHVRQWRSWFCKWLNHRYLRSINYLAFGLCYLLVLPILYTFRAKFEREAYTQSLLSSYELGYLTSPANRAYYYAHLLDNFTSKTYFFMARKKATEAWLGEVIEDILAGRITNDKDRVELLAA